MYKLVLLLTIAVTGISGQGLTKLNRGYYGGYFVGYGYSVASSSTKACFTNVLPLLDGAADAASNDLAQTFHAAFNCACDSDGDEAVSSEEFLECLPDVLKLFHPLLATLTIDPVQTQVKFDEYDDNQNGLIDEIGEAEHVLDDILSLVEDVENLHGNADICFLIALPTILEAVEGGPPSDPIDSYISAYDITDEAIESFNWALDCTCNNNDDGGVAYEELLECIPSVLPLFDKLFADIIVDADLVQGQFNAADSNENELIDEQEGESILETILSMVAVRAHLVCEDKEPLRKCKRKKAKGRCDRPKVSAVCHKTCGHCYPSPFGPPKGF